MPDFRSFFSPGEIDGETIRLSPAESRHLVSVNRARREAPVTAFDGRGSELGCVLAEADSRAAVLNIRERHVRTPLPYALTLAQALLKGKTFDLIVRHATELGVARIVPLETERTELRLDGKRREQKGEKWRTAAIEAAKQSGNPFVPEIAPATRLPEFLETTGACDLKLLASLTADARPLADAFPATARGSPEQPYRAVWLIGPEGDFTDGETESAEAHGILPVSLGPYVLRSETAALCALSIAAHELRNRLTVRASSSPPSR